MPQPQETLLRILRSLGVGSLWPSGPGFKDDSFRVSDVWQHLFAHQRERVPLDARRRLSTSTRLHFGDPHILRRASRRARQTTSCEDLVKYLCRDNFPSLASTETIPNRNDSQLVSICCAGTLQCCDNCVATEPNNKRA